MRPVNSMIEFKRNIGRGTRLFDGRDDFTLYDFVLAHTHFSDPEWDGDPIAVTTIDAPTGPGAADPEHDQHQLLECRLAADIGRAVPGNALRCPARLLPRRG
jgi:type I restriction enzyme R subunit